MRTNIELDEELLKEAMGLSGARTKKEVVNRALEEFVENHRRRDMRDLRGQISFRSDYDYKRLRREDEE